MTTKLSGSVHGGIRHLENNVVQKLATRIVHGGIRHLESDQYSKIQAYQVHGGIRHLEKLIGNPLSA